MKHCARTALVAGLALLLLTSTSLAQPTLDSLWPNTDGLSWSYVGTYRDLPGDPVGQYTPRLILDGTATMNPGVTVQRLVGQNFAPLVTKQVPGRPSASWEPLLRSLWWGRPDLRSGIEARAALEKRATFWPWLYLGPAEIDDGIGFRKTADRIGFWREMIGNWSWLYFDGAPTVGQSFTFQLVPDFASDVFLTVVVTSTTETISTPAGVFEDAVRLVLTVDQGTGYLTDEQGNELGTTESEIQGYVVFVPNVGPVAVEQKTIITMVDCPTGCPDFEELEGEELSVGTLFLREPSVTTESPSWSEVKVRY